MTLENFLKLYRGNERISIDGYCREKYYDYITVPKWVRNEEDMLEFETEYLSGNNPNHHIASCLFKETWWPEIKDMEVDSFSIIGGGIYPVELIITLQSKEDREE